MRIRRTLTLAGILAGSMVLGTAIPSIALWAASTSVTATASAGTLVPMITGFDGLTHTFTPTSLSKTSEVTLRNGGTLAATYKARLSLSDGSSPEMAKAVEVRVWSKTASAPCTPQAAPAASVTWTGNWQSFTGDNAVLDNQLGANSSETWCIRSTMTESMRQANQGRTISPTLTLTLKAGNWTTLPISQSATENVPDQVSPTAPGKPVASNTTANGTTLTWGASSDNVGVTAYRVYRSTDGGKNYTQLAEQSALSYTATGLLPLKSYIFDVTAIDAAGNESTRSTITVTTTKPAASTRYRIANDNSGMCVDVNGASTAAGSALIQFGCHSNSNQQFSFDAAGHIISRNATNLGWGVVGNTAGAQLTVDYLTRPSGSSANEADLWQLAAIDSPSLSYRFKLLGTNNNMCASVVGASKASGARIELATCDANNPAQTFTLTEMP